MYLTILEFIFIAIALTLTVLLVIREFGITKKLSPMKASDFVSSIVGLMFGYVLFALVLFIFIPGLLNKILMLMFGLSPFIIGKVVTYDKLKFYSILQILCVIISFGYVCLNIGI